MRDVQVVLQGLSARQLQALAVLGELRNIHRAAAALNVSQPAMSKLLSDLEKRIGAPLFTRGPRGVEPTRAGALLARTARVIQGEISRAADELESLSKGRPETLRIGTLQSSAATLVPDAVRRLREELPLLSISIIEGAIAPLIEQLSMSNIDVVVGRIGYRPKGGEFQEQYITAEKLRIAVRAGHPLAGRSRIGWADLRPFDWILPVRGTAMRDRVEMLLAETGMPMAQRICESSSSLCSLSLLSQTDMVMPLPDGLAQQYRTLGQAAILPITLPEMFGPIAALWRRDPPEPAAKARFVSLLLECAAERRGPQGRSAARAGRASTRASTLRA